MRNVRQLLRSQTDHLFMKMALASFFAFSFRYAGKRGDNAKLQSEFIETLKGGRNF